MLRVGTPENIYLPWAGKDSVTGEWSGFGVDLMEELASRTGFRSAYLHDSLSVYNGRKYFQLCILWEFIFIHRNRYSLTDLFWIMKSWQKWYDVFIVTDVSKNITDMTLPVYFISLERALIADFTVPYSAIEAVVFMKRPQVSYEETMKKSSSNFWIYRVSGLSCPEAQAYLTVIFHSFLHNNNINSDYILGANIYFTPHSIFSSYFWANN